MTGSSTTGRKYHRRSARDRAWIAFVWTFSGGGRGMLHGVGGGDRRSAPPTPEGGRAQRSSARLLGRALDLCEERLGGRVEERPEGHASTLPPFHSASASAFSLRR